MKENIQQTALTKHFRALGTSISLTVFGTLDQTVLEKSADLVNHYEDVFIIEKFDFNDLLYFRYLFIAKEGWNLRNEIAHGILIPEQYTVELFNWVFFFFS